MSALYTPAPPCSSYTPHTHVTIYAATLRQDCNFASDKHTLGDFMEHAFAHC